MFYPEELDTFPLGFDNIHHKQHNDATIQEGLQMQCYMLQTFHGVCLACLHCNNQHKIMLPLERQCSTIMWYHFIMGHIGSACLTATLSVIFYFQHLKATVEHYITTCDSFQHNKQPGLSYGHIPPIQDVSTLWEEVAVDLIGPWKIQVQGIGHLCITTLSIIDTCMTLTELVHITNKTSTYTAHKLYQA